MYYFTYETLDRNQKFWEFDFNKTIKIRKEFKTLQEARNARRIIQESIDNGSCSKFTDYIRLGWILTKE